MPRSASTARASTRKPAIWTGRAITVPIPKGRDPFVNTPLLSLGAGPDGEERFWISTWNSCVGCLGVVITESGKFRLYRFGSQRHGGFYSAALEDSDTLWLCGNLSRVVRLTLSTGRFKEFSTGAPSALVFQGMVLDPRTGKLFAAAYPYSSSNCPMAFSFDFRRRRPVKVFADLGPEKYMRFHFPNGDGSYSCVMHTPGQSLLRWDPVAETVTVIGEQAAGTTVRLISDDRGRWYFPGRGWYNPASRQVESDGPRPKRDMIWFARRESRAWGIEGKDGNAHAGVWDMASGEVTALCMIPNASQFNVALSRAGKLVAVNMYGVFSRFDGTTGSLEMSRRLPTDSYGKVDCLRRIDKRRLLGTPFITQRFWEVDLKTGRGADLGRGAPGGGEILQTWRIGGKVYMAAYTGGELVEYDPRRPACFPENPRVVADPPGGMRPVAAADDGRHLYYSCSRHYGTLGSVLTKYDTRTGMALYKADPLPDQQIRSLAYDRTTDSLLCGSTMDADCRSTAPSTDRCFFASIRAGDLEVQAQVPAPPGTRMARVVGPMGKGAFLCLCPGCVEGPDPWCVLAPSNLQLPPTDRMARLPENTRRIVWAETPGLFVLRIENRIELWDMRLPRCVRVLCKRFTGYGFEAQDGALYLVYPRKIAILEGCLA